MRAELSGDFSTNDAIPSTAADYDYDTDSDLDVAEVVEPERDSEETASESQKKARLALSCCGIFDVSDAFQDQAADDGAGSDLTIPDLRRSQRGSIFTHSGSLGADVGW